MENINVPSAAEFAFIICPLSRISSIGTPGKGQFAEPVLAKIVEPKIFVPVLSTIENVADPIE